jgi:hypothetical protein
VKKPSSIPANSGFRLFSNCPGVPVATAVKIVAVSTLTRHAAAPSVGFSAVIKMSVVTFLFRNQLADSLK